MFSLDNTVYKLHNYFTIGNWFQITVCNEGDTKEVENISYEYVEHYTIVLKPMKNSHGGKTNPWESNGNNSVSMIEKKLPIFWENILTDI